MKAKTVYGSLNVLRPKSQSEILDAIQKEYRYKDLQLALKFLPTLDKFFQSFVYKKYMWNGKGRFVDYDSSEYQEIDLTEEAKKIISQAIGGLNGKLHVAHTTAGLKHGIISFMYRVKEFRGDHYSQSPNKNIFRYFYRGNDFGYVGDTSGIGIFIIPEDFIKNFFGK